MTRRYARTWYDSNGRMVRDPQPNAHDNGCDPSQWTTPGDAAQSEKTCSLCSWARREAERLNAYDRRCARRFP